MSCAAVVARRPEPDPVARAASRENARSPAGGDGGMYKRPQVVCRQRTGGRVIPGSFSCHKYRFSVCRLLLLEHKPLLLLKMFGFRRLNAFLMEKLCLTALSLKVSKFVFQRVRLWILSENLETFGAENLVLPGRWLILVCRA